MKNIPQYAMDALNILEKNGFDAFLVGGCVRDFIMGIVPHDFDIATNAVPQQIKNIFNQYKTISIGEKHGTIIVVIDGNPIEITAYRIDGNYSDNRRPDKVTFSNSLVEDLRRRDFTINAMAMDKNGNIIDPFGGQDNMKNCIIKAVGSAEKRFTEDALRILRALRFASRLGFSLDEDTSEAVFKCRFLLNNISAERIRDEFIGIICGKNSENILRVYRNVISVFIPEIAPCFEFEQHSPYHKYDVWEHTIHAVYSAANKEKVKIAMFFHDIAKPECYNLDNFGRGHFKGHAKISAEKTREIMRRLKFSKRDINSVTTLIDHHSDSLDSRYELRRIVGTIGFENTLDLLDVQRADSLSKQEFCRERLKKSDYQEKIVREIAENYECVQVKDLNINGRDLEMLGFKNAEIRIVLDILLENVMMGKIENENFVLNNYAKLLKKHHKIVQNDNL